MEWCDWINLAFLWPKELKVRSSKFNQPDLAKIVYIFLTIKSPSIKNNVLKAKLYQKVLHMVILYTSQTTHIS